MFTAAIAMVRPFVPTNFCRMASSARHGLIPRTVGQLHGAALQRFANDSSRLLGNGIAPNAMAIRRFASDSSGAPSTIPDLLKHKSAESLKHLFAGPAATSQTINKKIAAIHENSKISNEQINDEIEKLLLDQLIKGFQACRKDAPYLRITLTKESFNGLSIHEIMMETNKHGENIEQALILALAKGDDEKLLQELQELLTRIKAQYYSGPNVEEFLQHLNKIAIQHDLSRISDQIVEILQQKQEERKVSHSYNNFPAGC
jgi:hypothetical protein